MSSEYGLESQRVLEVLREIRDLLVPIAACFESQYLEIQQERTEVKFGELQELLTPQRKVIFPLLFDSRCLSQAQIAGEANTTQPTVSRLISTLLERGLIAQIDDGLGGTRYEDTFGLSRLVQEEG